MSKLQKRHAKEVRREKQKKAKRLLTTRALCERFGVVDRTIYRWEEAGILPEPLRIRGRRYWEEGVIEEVERAAFGERPASGSERTRYQPAEVEITAA